MEDLTAEERAGLNTRFNLSRMKTLRLQIPTVEVHTKQQFLPSGTCCSVFKFLLPLKIAAWVGENLREGMFMSFTILGGPGCFSDDKKDLAQTYYEKFRIRGNDLVQPFTSMMHLMHLNGHVDVNDVDIDAFTAISKMKLRERTALILRLNSALESCRTEILQTARVYGVLNTLREAEQKISCAKYDAECVTQEIFNDQQRYA